MEKRLDQILKAINTEGRLYEAAVEEALERQKILAKPTGALGALEDISVQLAGITGKVKNSAEKKAIVIMSADNGVTEEGVASAPQSVTLSQTCLLYTSLERFPGTYYIVYDKYFFAAHLIRLFFTYAQSLDVVGSY